MKMEKLDRPVYRSMLYIPGNSPGMLQHAPIFGADSVLLDLEDAVARSEKDAARRLVARMLRTIDFGRVLATVRVNGADTEYFERDLAEIVPAAPGAVRLPKCSCAEDITRADARISEIERENGMEPGTVKIHAMLETTAGIVNAQSIAAASPRIEALTIGGQDLIADMGAQKTKEGWELFAARSSVLMAAKSAGLDAYDTVWTDVNDEEGLYAETKFVIELGFSGKAAIHPSQVPVIHRAFMPDAEEVAHAERVVAAARDATERGVGVISVDGKMVDPPVVARANRIMQLARLSRRGTTS